MPPPTSVAVGVSSSTSSSVNSRGAAVWRTITPMTSPVRAGIGTAAIDCQRSSSSSGKYFIRGSWSASSRISACSPVRATQPVTPSSKPIEMRPTKSACTGEAARSTRRSPSTR